MFYTVKYPSSTGAKVSCFFDRLTHKSMIFDSTHPSKRLSDLKHNATQEKAPFSGTVFNTL